MVRNQLMEKESLITIHYVSILLYVVVKRFQPYSIFTVLSFYFETVFIHFFMILYGILCNCIPFINNKETHMIQLFHRCVSDCLCFHIT